MLRSIAGALAPTARTAVRTARLPARVPSLSNLPRSFTTSSCRGNDKFDSPAPPQPPASEDTQLPTASQNISESVAEEASVPAEGAVTPKRDAPTSSLDDILGSVSAVALPGSQSKPTKAQETSMQTREEGQNFATPESRYGPRSTLSSATAHRLHVKASRNNIIITFTNPDGETLATASGGSVGFKNTQQSEYEAGYRAAFAVFDKIEKYKQAWSVLHLEIFWNGFGQGREAVFRALLSDKGAAIKELVSRMTDTTPIKVGGVRPKKRRML